jgi:class 3 adenylate cyclase
MDSRLPSGTVTFLFTDIEGSTTLWERHPDAMRDALVRHEALLRQAIESSNGCLVKSTGDGVYAAFAAATDAVAACLAIQRALLAEANAIAADVGAGPDSELVLALARVRSLTEHGHDSK